MICYYTSQNIQLLLWYIFIKIEHENMKTAKYFEVIIKNCCQVNTLNLQVTLTIIINLIK
jgi:hypothetical protein